MKETYISTSCAILPPTYNESKSDDGEPYVVLSDEEDISSELKKSQSNKPVHILRADISWNTEVATSICYFDDAIVEDSENIRLPGLNRVQ